MYKILIVDDEPYIREGLHKIINEQKSNYSVCGEAEDGIEALDLIEQLSPDIVITDIRMIEMDGPELIKRAHEKYDNKIKFIIISAYGEFEYAQIAIKYGVSDYILKPIRPQELIETINRIVNKIMIDNSKQNEYKIALRTKMNQNMYLFLTKQLEENELTEMVNYFHIDKMQNFRCLIIKINSKIKEVNNSLYFGVVEIINKNEAIRIIIEENQQNIVCIIEEEILNSSKEEYYNSIFSDEQWKELSAKVTIFLGRSYQGFINIKESYQEAIRIYKERFYQEHRFLVFAEETLKPNIKRHTKLEVLPYLETVEENILEKDPEALNRNVNFLFTYCKLQYLDPSFIKIKLMNFTVSISDRIIEFGGDNQEIINRSLSIFNFDVELMTIVELELVFMQFCMDSIYAFNELNSDRQSDLVYKIQNYLNDNFRGDLKMKDIADKFYMNSVYLGQIFKKKTGISINEHLNNLRIEEAKKLLRFTNYKVYEISTMIGFVNSAYFTTKFEKIVGVTPLHYRKEN